MKKIIFFISLLLYTTIAKASFLDASKEYSNTKEIPKKEES